MSTRPIRKQDINATLSEINQVNQCHVEANAFMKCLRENKFDEGRCVTELRALQHCQIFMQKPDKRQRKAERRAVTFHLLRLANRIPK